MNKHTALQRLDTARRLIENLDEDSKVYRITLDLLHKSQTLVAVHTSQKPTGLLDYETLACSPLDTNQAYHHRFYPASSEDGIAAGYIYLAKVNITMQEADQ